MLRLDRLVQNVPIADVNGNPTPQFIVFWQRFATSIENSVNGVQAALDAAAAANMAADNAQVAATNAQTAADTTNAQSSLANSYPSGVTISATDAGTSVTISISAHTRVYGNGTSVPVAAGTVTGQPYGATLYIYYDDPTRAGGAVSYQTTTSDTVAAQTGSRNVVGQVITPAAAGSPAPGKPVRPPGSGAIP